MEHLKFLKCASRQELISLRLANIFHDGFDASFLQKFIFEEIAVLRYIIFVMCLNFAAKYVSCQLLNFVPVVKSNEFQQGSPFCIQTTWK